MIESGTGNLLEADAEALVNTVNCDGFMGKGIALQFKKAFPANFEAYAKACKSGDVRPGRVFVYETGALVNPKLIINFPTKRHWREKARLEDIVDGLNDLVGEVRARGVRSLAVPPLGCGLGGLDWSAVRPLIERAFAELPDVRALVFAPRGEPEAAVQPVGTARPAMTVARALFVMAMRKYKSLDYRLTMLEVQKLAYFLQEAGQQLRLRFEAGPYGPYADNLNHVLRDIEGHLTRGYRGTRKPDDEIELLAGAVEEAERFLADRPEERERLDRVADLIAGFETPYGMELLSSVHWVATKGERRPDAPDQVVALVHAWNERKRRVLKPDHIRIAWQHLEESGWM